MKAGLALVPELAQASRYASICIVSTTIASKAFSESSPGLGLFQVAQTDAVRNQFGSKVYIAKPDPVLSVFKFRNVAQILGKNFMAHTVTWMNALQSNIAELAEEDEYDDSESELEVPPFKPVIEQCGIGVIRDFSIQVVRRIYEHIASSLVEPRLACKLLKDAHKSAVRKRLRYCFAGMPIHQRIQTACSNIYRMTFTVGRSACLGSLAELTVRELVIVYRTVPSVRNKRNFEDDEEYEGISSLDYFQYHTFWNFTRISVRLLLASLAAGLGSLVALEPEFWPAAGKLPTMAGWLIGETTGLVLVGYIQQKYTP